MPKLKTNKSIKKRFKITGKKKVIGSRTKRRHLLGDRSTSKKRRNRRPQTFGPADRKAVLGSLPYDR